MSEIITREALLRLADDWVGGGAVLVGPRRVQPDRVLYSRLPDAAALELDGFIHPANSVKEFVLPRHEVLYAYRFKGNDVELEDRPPVAPPTLVLGARPCDAAALALLDHVFNWDFKDAFYNAHRESLTVVTLACARHDDSCFCTSVGLSPVAEKGSDALLLEMGDGSYEVRCCTDRGRALFAGKTTPGSRPAPEPAGPKPRFSVEDVDAFLKDHFEDPIWKERSLRCLGCGACAFTCPTCHCFDIVDEGNARGGVRARNWDACQFKMFTLHASGHNPRGSQPDRQRQRIMHKYHIYPDKFGEWLCTGCGNCVRNCPVHLGVLGLLEAASAAGQAAGAAKP